MSINSSDPWETLNPTFAGIRREGRVLPEHYEAIHDAFPDKTTKALELVANRKVEMLETNQSRVFWVVHGSSGTYLTFPDFYCTCPDFLFHGVMKGVRRHVCYHLLARKLAEVTGFFEKTAVTEREFARFLKDVIKFFR
ncbi:MAG: hypothetical protein Kow0069_01390 [Promethearchaeota archaeon]